MVKVMHLHQDLPLEENVHQNCVPTHYNLTLSESLVLGVP